MIRIIPIMSPQERNSVDLSKKDKVSSVPFILSEGSLELVYQNEF